MGANIGEGHGQSGRDGGLRSGEVRRANAADRARETAGQFPVIHEVGDRSCCKAAFVELRDLGQGRLGVQFMWTVQARGRFTRGQLGLVVVMGLVWSIVDGIPFQVRASGPCCGCAPGLTDLEVDPAPLQPAADNHQLSTDGGRAVVRLSRRPLCRASAASSVGNSRGALR